MHDFETTVPGEEGRFGVFGRLRENDNGMLRHWLRKNLSDCRRASCAVGTRQVGGIRTGTIWTSQRAVYRADVANPQIKRGEGSCAADMDGVEGLL